MFCSKCGKEILEGSSYCQHCGGNLSGASANTQRQALSSGLTKTVKTSKIVMGIIVGLIVFAIAAKIIVFLVALIGALGLGAIGIHISQNPEAYKDVEAAANILGFIGGAYLFIKIYKKITRSMRRNDPIVKQDA